jgi:transcriptional regulator with XRE-family HTH domain
MRTGGASVLLRRGVLPRSGVTFTFAISKRAPFIISILGVAVSTSLSGSISARIKATREARGLTASQLSRLVGVTPAAVWFWEKKGFSPGNPSLDGIAKALGVSTRFLLSGKEGVEIEFASQPIVASILEDARARIAKAIGLDLERVKLGVQFVERD